MEPLLVEQMTARIHEQLADALGAKGNTMQKRLAYVSRRLPARVRKAGETLVEAQEMAKSPRMSMQIDADAFSAAYDVLNRHLTEVDSVAERSRKRYNMMAAIAAQVLLVIIVIVVLMKWLT